MKTFLKAAIIFFLFFCGTSALITIDCRCMEYTGEGGQLTPQIKRAGDDHIEVNFLGLNKIVDIGAILK